MSYSVIKAELHSHKQDIIDIWEKNFPGEIIPKYEWLYELNPAGRAHVWLVRQNESNRYVGTTAVFPREFLVKGKKILAGIAGDFLINLEHRSLGPALMLQKAVLSFVQNDKMAFVYGFPNEKSAPVFKRVGFRILGEKARMVKILSFRDLLDVRFGRSAARVLGPILDCISKAGSSIVWGKKNRGYRGEEVSNIHKFLELFSDNGFKGFLIHGNRTTEYLKWKFVNSPMIKNKLFALLDEKSGKPKAYLVYRSLANTVEIRDFSYTEERGVPETLVRDFVKHAKSLGADRVVVSMLRNKELVTRFGSLGFYDRPVEGDVYAYFGQNLLKWSNLIEDVDNWFLLQSDDDM
jgi:hypothetical protein